jgi:dTDP-4-dehydrorhamnose reductase
MSKRVVVVGRGGQLGTELVKVFSRSGYEVKGFTRQELDISDWSAVERTMADADPSVILNAAAYNKVDVAEREPQLAYLGNALAVRNLALAARQVDAQLVTFSTDYVFDGMAGRPYTEEDHTHPLGAYAVSKLAGELYAHAYLQAPLIIRTSGVFGPAGLRTAGGNFVEKPCFAWPAPAIPSAWWRTMSPLPPMRRRWRSGRLLWWSETPPGFFTSAADCLSPGLIMRA